MICLILKSLTLKEMHTISDILLIKTVTQKAPLATCFNIKQIKSNSLWLEDQSKVKSNSQVRERFLSPERNECEPLSGVAGGLPGLCRVEDISMVSGCMQVSE